MKAFLSFFGRLDYDGAARLFDRFALAVCFALCLLSSTAFGHPGVEDRIHQLDHDIASQVDNQYLYIQRSLAHSENGSPQKAMQDIEFASTLGDAIDVAFVRGVLQYRAGNFSVARQYFDETLAAYPNHLESLEYRARLLRDTDDSKAALEDFLRIFNLNSTPNPGLYISAADIMATLPEYDVEAAVSLLDAGMTKIGAVTQLQRHAIALEQARGNYEAAIGRMEQLPSTLRATPQWKIELAQLHLLNNEPQRAQSLLQTANSQLAGMPRNGILDEARAKLQQITEQLASSAAVDQRKAKSP